MQCTAVRLLASSATATLLRLTLTFPAKLTMHMKLLAKLTDTASYAARRVEGACQESNTSWRIGVGQLCNGSQ